MVTLQDTLVQLARAIIPYWYDPDKPFNHNDEIYNLISQISREWMKQPDTLYRTEAECYATKWLIGIYFPD